MHATLELDFKNPKIIKKVLQPDLDAELITSRNKLVIKISGKDFSSLRAKVTSALRLVHVAKGIAEM
jgi:tRNA threonylcarbamoyladenosine modification (KEOPS) complex  Pcc1 subunit